MSANGKASPETPLLSAHSATDDNPKSHERLSTTQILVMAPGLALGVLLMGADGVLENAAYTRIGSDFHQLRHVSWLTLAYIVSVTASQPIYSRLSDIYGRKLLLLGSYIVFGIGVGICSISNFFWILVIARGIVGLGAAGMGFLVSVILNDIVILRERAIWQGGLQVVMLCGQLIGGPLGGQVVDKLGWRLAFFIELPVAVLLFFLVLFTLQLPALPTQKARRTETESSQGALPRVDLKFDISGSFVLLLCIIALVLGLNMAGNDVPWSHPLIPTLLCLSIVLLAIFVFIDTHTSSVPLIPMNLLCQRSIASLNGAEFFKSMANMALFYLTPFYVHASGRGGTAYGGLLVTLTSVGTALGQLGTGLQLHRSGRPWYVLVGSALLYFAVSAIMRLRWTGSEGEWEHVVDLLVAGAAVGGMTSALLVGLLKGTVNTDRAAIYGAYHIFTSAGNMVSLAAVSTVLQFRTRIYLEMNLDGDFPGDIQKLVGECLASLDCLEPLSDPIRALVRESFVRAIDDCISFVCAVAALALIAALFTKRYRIGPDDE